ncbi:uncharacterized protein LOC128160612 isoform X2 [Crassostrea angulata]|uniref:uncharacterized protein LOC128160612 isoform X2 n=1 Tax=Magallana angulata TaxID=2784310 RepID=UPI0022B19855|nr:uncharacterized protein LOC128160612 isoform X2 [Crassostrea angulata]
MDQGTPGYWIQDAVTEFSVVNKGCQKNVNVLGSTTIENNRLLNCFQFCQNNANTTTIGGNNCSCLASLTSDTYLPIDNCDIPCVWEDRLCEMATFFSVFERQDSIGTLGGFQIEECISIESGRAYKLNCSSQNMYICQKNDILIDIRDKVTWIEAVSKCAKQNQTLAYYLPTHEKYRRLHSSRYWIGIRQFYQIETVKQGSSSCPVIRRYNRDDIIVENLNCDEEKKYICSEENIDQEQESQIHEIGETRKSFLAKDSSDSSSSNVVGIVIGVLATVAILLLVFVCLYKRRRNNLRSAYHSPVVEYATQQRRDSKQSQTRSVKSSPLKPVRRSKKANPDSLVSGTEYENIVLTFEDPSTISRVVSSTSTDKTEIPKEEENYDVMNAENKTTSSNVISQNVYGFSPPEGEYDVMNRENRNVDEFNPDYDHM